MKILFTTPCKPIPIFLGKFLSIDDVSYRFVFNQGVFSATAEVPSFSLHFLAQNLNVPSVVLEWPTFEELEAELKSDHYDYVAISFKCLDLYRVAEMLDFIHKVSPGTQIILGGYGTLALDEPEAEYIRDHAEHICRFGEGVRFIRNIIGDYEPRPMVSHLPAEVIRIPWLSASTRIGYILSALGCVWKCEFCCTSAYAEGRVIEVMSPEEIHESMRWYYKTYPDLGQIYMMDEELLLRKNKVNALGELIRNDDIGLTRMSYLAFGTIHAISRWDPEELLLNGVGQVWAGIESLYSYGRKKGTDKVDSKDLIQGLLDHGIEAQLSWIVGDDCQNKENINADIDDLIAHEPTTIQLSILSAAPGTALYTRLKADNRIRPFVPEEAHLMGDTMDALHFTHKERLDILMNTYTRIYETHGSSLMRAAKAFMNGYEHCLRSKNPYLNGPKRAYFERKIKNNITLIRVALETAPTLQVKQAMLDLRDRYIDLFGPFRKTQQIAAEHFLRLANQEIERREREGYSTMRDVPLKRYTYQGGARISQS